MHKLLTGGVALICFVFVTLVFLANTSVWAQVSWAVGTECPTCNRSSGTTPAPSGSSQQNFLAQQEQERQEQERQRLEELRRQQQIEAQQRAYQAQLAAFQRQQEALRQRQQAIIDRANAKVQSYQQMGQTLQSGMNAIAQLLQQKMEREEAQRKQQEAETEMRELKERQQREMDEWHDQTMAKLQQDSQLNQGQPDYTGSPSDQFSSLTGAAAPAQPLENLTSPGQDDDVATSLTLSDYARAAWYAAKDTAHDIAGVMRDIARPIGQEIFSQLIHGEDGSLHDAVRDATYGEVGGLGRSLLESVEDTFPENPRIAYRVFKPFVTAVNINGFREHSLDLFEKEVVPLANQHMGIQPSDQPDSNNSNQ